MLEVVIILVVSLFALDTIIRLVIVANTGKRLEREKERLRDIIDKYYR